MDAVPPVTTRDLQIIDQTTSGLCAVHSRASGYRLRCVGFAAKSAENARHLSENPENLLTKVNRGRMTVAGMIVMI